MNRSLLAVTLLLAAACSEPNRELTLDPPLASLRHTPNTSEVWIQAAPGVALDSLVSVAPFGDLLPGITAEEAEARFGIPGQVTAGRGQDQTYAFTVPEGEIEVAQRWMGSEDVLVERWFLAFVPKQPWLQAHLSAELIAVLPAVREPLSVHVIADDGQATVEVDGEKLKRIWWSREGRADPEGPSPVT
jgi:hypothetical protein